MEFNQLKTTRKGNLAEQYVIDYLSNELGYTLWWNQNDKSTIYDGSGYSGTTREQKNLFEVKLKSRTKYGSYSIHQNDLEKYKEEEKLENKQMIIIYVDPKHQELQFTTTKMIDKSTKMIVWDTEEKKNLVYFTSYKTKKKIETEFITKLNLIV